MLTRIQNLAAAQVKDKTKFPLVYVNAEISRPQINRELKNKAGIYLWWCSVTGLFYIGSAKSLTGKNGRLNEYYQKKRLLETKNSPTKTTPDIVRLNSSYEADFF